MMFLDLKVKMNSDLKDIFKNDASIFTKFILRVSMSSSLVVRVFFLISCPIFVKSTHFKAVLQKGSSFVGYAYFWDLS